MHKSSKQSKITTQIKKTKTTRHTKFKSIQIPTANRNELTIQVKFNQYQLKTPKNQVNNITIKNKITTT